MVILLLITHHGLETSNKILDVLNNSFQTTLCGDAISINCSK